MEQALSPKVAWYPPRSILAVALIALFLLMAFAFPMLTSRAEDPASVAEARLQEEHQMLERLNAVRADYGLHPLTINSNLETAADAHVAESASRNWMSHYGADGSTYYDRAARAGYTGSRVNEAVGWGYNLDRMLTWWLNSPVHRPILLSAEYTEIGIGYLGNPNDRWGHWWVINFATP